MPDHANSISIFANSLTGLLRHEELPIGGMLAATPLGDRLGLRQLSLLAGFDGPGFREQHRHDAWVVVGTLSGQAQLDCEGIHADVDAGDVYLIPPDQPFLEATLGAVPWAWCVLQLWEAGDAQLTAELPRVPLLFHAGFRFFERMIELLRRLNHREDGDELTVLGLLLAILGECQQQCRDTTEATPFVERAFAFMQDHAHGTLALPAVAQQCHMSLSSFSHRFKAETGITPMRWLTRERMRLARQLLLQGRTVGETAQELGYATPFHFSRVFTQSEGIPPSQFQRLFRLRR